MGKKMSKISQPCSSQLQANLRGKKLDFTSKAICMYSGQLTTKMLLGKHIHLAMI
jgi:hypothetical protein